VGYHTQKTKELSQKREDGSLENKMIKKGIRKRASSNLLHWAQWVRRYPGRYVAVVDGKVLGVGRSRLSAFRKIEKKISPQKEVGLFYIPTPDQYPMLLHAIFLSRN